MKLKYKTLRTQVYLIYSPSINNQCPVSTQIQTMNNAIEKDNSSAVVKRPHIPNEILGKKDAMKKTNISF